MTMQFYRDGRALSGTPTAAIRNKGNILLNAAAVREFGIEKGSHFALLGFDADKNEIGIKLLKTGETGSRKICRGASGASISAKTFFDHFDIPYDGPSKRYDIARDKKSDLLVFCLK